MTCQGITKIGAKCSKNAVNCGHFCGIHKNMDTATCEITSDYVFMEKSKNKMTLLFNEINNFYSKKLKEKDEEIDLFKNESNQFELNLSFKIIEEQKIIINDRNKLIENNDKDLINLKKELNSKNKIINDRNKLIENNHKELINLKKGLENNLNEINNRKITLNNKVKITESMKKLRDVIMEGKIISSKIIIDDTTFNLKYHKQSIIGDIVEFEKELTSELLYLTYGVDHESIRHIILNGNNFNINFSDYFHNYLKEWTNINEKEYGLNISIKHDKNDVWGILVLEVLNDQRKMAEYIENNNRISKCIICFDNDKNIILHPCNHIICCDVCIKNNSVKLCPVCRIKITNHQIVYY